MTDNDKAMEPDVTTLLQRASKGDTEATDQLLPLVYQKLRAIAQLRMASENPGHTLQATGLVHEVFIRMLGSRQVPWKDRAHFYAAAAEAMRRVLVDHAKSKKRQKRGGGRKKLSLEATDVAELAQNDDPELILALNSALCRLEEQNHEAAQVVRLRFFAGLSVDETAEAMNLGARTVDRRWKYARAWLFQELCKDNESVIGDA